MRILLTSTSFQDTPGKHQELLSGLNFQVDTLRGPLKKDSLLPVIQNYDAIICGDDEIDEEVLIKGKNGKLKAISKYGIGMDKIDLKAAAQLGIAVKNCPGVNHITVAEHFFALLLTFYKNVHLEYNITKRNKWERLIGHEIFGKKLGILGLGRIGKEIAMRASCFGMDLSGYDKLPDYEFCSKYKIALKDSIESLVKDIDVLSLNLNLDNSTKGIINYNLFSKMKKGVVIVNTARGGLVDLNSLIRGIEDKIIGGYLTDVLEEEPMPDNYPLLNYENVIITPHTGSRTYESVERQGIMAVENLIEMLK
jgi:D-3-phosphoglycerate dehydrogenase